MFMTIEGVELVQDVKPALLGWIEEERASCEDGLMENHNYVDMRGEGVDDLNYILAIECELFELIESYTGDGDGLIHWLEVNTEDFYENGFLPVEFGIGSSVVAVSVLGCIPITSCRGRTLDFDHSHEAPTVAFYATEDHLDTLLRAAKNSGVSIVNNGEMVEVYSDDLRKMHIFAGCVRDLIQEAQVPS